MTLVADRSGVRPIRVVAADDSAVMRGVYRRLFARGAESIGGGYGAIELCDIVEDGIACLAAVDRLRPDVVVLDIEMPRMHGLDVLKRLRDEEPGLAVILCSSATETGAQVTIEALILGAKDYVTKPTASDGAAHAMDVLGDQLLTKIAVLGQKRRDGYANDDFNVACAPMKQIPLDLAARTPVVADAVVIGVSTGGPAALERMLAQLPADFPAPLLIAQHMPKVFTGALTERLNRCCALEVREAFEGAAIRGGEVWLAPGDANMEIVERIAVGGPLPVIKLARDTERNFCTPSVDVLFRSAARTYGAGTLAVVMTGMGADGLAGARAIHQAGGTVLAQDAASSAVWGMPGRVFEAGIVRRLLPLEEIANELVACVAPRAGERSQAPGCSLREGTDGAAALAACGRVHGVY